MIDWLYNYNSPNHLDVILFGMFWSLMMIEYIAWRFAWKK